MAIDALSKPVIPLRPVTQAYADPSPAGLPLNGKHFFIWTIGCQMNEADSSKVAAMLQEVGYQRTDDEALADIVVLNSCVVRQAAEDKVAGKLNALAKLKRQKPEMPLVLTGCMVTRQQEQLKQRFPHVDLFFDPSDFDKLQRVVPELSRLDDDLHALPHYYQPETDAGTSGVTAYVPIIYGCNFLCSYCIVPYRRGKETSRPFADIVLEVERIVASGVREVTLLGQTVNAYGHDLPGTPSLAALLEAVDAIPGLERLRFLTSHPKYMGDDIISAMATLPSACEHMNLPVQAGDNEVLRRMRRTYTRDVWMERISMTRQLMPDATIATDIIVGFPGETEEQFMQTYDMLERTRCDKVHLAMYSPRPGTLSARWEDDVPHEEKFRRHQALEELQERICTEINARRLGETYEVLVEGKSKGRWTGRTRGNTLVHFDDERELAGKLVDVRITRTLPWYLMGETVGIPR
ncbi:MAG TPA: tRNA (N6-isopentenyl adenosine(37)-C2)-methylthiotransferase MiaB [Thermomicrobiales bacterium]|nr:tRNA (N6-isopentenyl adenosine(37)-C2)-methylthiotransferase MiaB [Thermomicrobiales bacterium]